MFQDIRPPECAKSHPVLNKQNLHPTTQPAIPTPSTQLPTTNTQAIVLDQQTLTDSAVTTPTLGASTAYGTTTSVDTGENLQEPTNTYALIEEPTIKPPPAHQEETTVQPSIAQEPVSLI